MTTARRTLLAAALCSAALVSACTSDGPDGSGGSGDGAPAAGLRPVAAQPVVAPGTGPGALSVSTSSALFDSAPAVVVAVAIDAAGVQEGTAQAERLGVPLLLQEGPPPAVDPALRAEVDRLGARDVLLVGQASALTDLPGSTTSADDLPDLGRAEPAQVDVLVEAGDEPGRLAAAATARAAGATVVRTAGADPRADPAAVDALKAGGRGVVAVGDAFGPPERLASRVAVAATGVQLPGGGQVLFPGRRLVALYGSPGSGALGVLGEQGLEASIARAKEVAEPYDALSDVPVVPTFEIIVTVASASAGPDGNYSTEIAVDELRPWVEQAGRDGVYVVLDLQPGRSDFLSQAKAYEPLLRLPHVGLALDSEWRLKPDQVHLRQIGSVGIDEVNGVVDWLADLTARERLPQKLLVLHQFKLSMIQDEQRLDTSRDELAVLIHMDGQGAPSLKDGTWGAVVRAAPPGVTFGWKNFYDEDEPMLTPAQTMTRRPTPVMISYQ